MILGPHALAGAATAIIFRKYPIIAVIAAFLSHFLLDAIPHWHYKLKSVKKCDSRFGLSDATAAAAKECFVFDKRFLSDLGKTGLDFSIGLLVSLLITEILFPWYFWLVFAGAGAAVLPDALQPLCQLFPKTFSWFQRFHKAIHSKRNIDDDFIRGNIYQVGFSLAIIIILVLMR